MAGWRRKLVIAIAIAVCAARAAHAGEAALDLATRFMQDYDRACRNGAPVAIASSRESLAMLVNIRDVLGLPKLELSAEETVSLDRLIRVMPKLAGPSGRFDHADIEPIIRSIGEDLQEEVGREIVRRASARVEAGSFGESLRRKAVEAHLERHGDAYFQHGLEEAREQVRAGLRTFLHETGTASAAPEPEDARPITLDELKQFGRDALVLQVIARRSAERGLPRFTFPNGMGTEDLIAIRAGEPPPNGKIVAHP